MHDKSFQSKIEKELKKIEQAHAAIKKHHAENMKKKYAVKAAPKRARVAKSPKE